MHHQAQSVSEAAAGVGVAVRQTRREIRQLIWQTVLVASGLWKTATACAVEFAAGLAEALEYGTRPIPNAEDGRWNRDIVWNLRSRLGRAARRCEPIARGWQRRATRLDQHALDRRLADDDARDRAVIPARVPADDRSSGEA
ncbi:MAG: hypothetical protein ACRDIY_08500 [Chloroflexota bacterium]